MSASALIALSPVSKPTRDEPIRSLRSRYFWFRERLDRGRVERPLAFAQRPVDRMFGNDGLAATGRSGDEDGSSGIEVFDGLQLKAVKGEVAAG